jgi:hypothetical protein
MEIYKTWKYKIRRRKRLKLTTLISGHTIYGVVNEVLWSQEFTGWADCAQYTPVSQNLVFFGLISLICVFEAEYRSYF